MSASSSPILGLTLVAAWEASNRQAPVLRHHYSDEDVEAYQTVCGSRRISHSDRAEWCDDFKFISAAAAVEATRLFEKKQDRQGVPVSEALAKEIIVAMAAVEVDKLIETKGLYSIDREAAKIAAQQKVVAVIGEDDYYY